MSNVGKWHHRADSPFGPTERSYALIAQWLDGMVPMVEDWGCGTAVLKKYLHASRYHGVDGSPGFADHLMDLEHSDLPERGAPAVVLRHVLDHNEQWETVLRNALRRANVRFVLCLFVPLGTETKVLSRSEQSEWWDAGIPDMQFAEPDLRRIFEAEGWGVVQRSVLRGAEYGALGEETIFFLRRWTPLKEEARRLGWT